MPPAHRNLRRYATAEVSYQHQRQGMALKAPPCVLGFHHQCFCQNRRSPLLGCEMGRARQKSNGFIPSIALHIPVTGRSFGPFT